MKNYFAKADLHVHSRASNQPAGWFTSLLECAESYTEPLEIYYTLKERGMNFITITDHNTIEGVLEIAHFPEVFISCEYTVKVPEEEAFVHVLVYGIEEKHHEDLLKLRENLYEFVSYLKVYSFPYVLAHPFYPINGTKITKKFIEKMILLFDNWELINGARGNKTSYLEERILRKYDGWENIRKLEERYNMKSLRTRDKISFTAGSDDHSGLYVGTTKTLVEKASDIESFLKGLFEGRTKIETENLNNEILFNMVAKVGYNCFERKYFFPAELKPFLDYMFMESHKNLQISYILRYLFGINNNGELPLKTVMNQLPFLALNKFIQKPNLQGLGEVIISFLLHILPIFLKLFHKKEEERVYSLAKAFEIEYKKPIKIAYFTDTYFDINGVARTAQIIREILKEENLPFTIITVSERAYREEKFITLKGYYSFAFPFYKDFNLYIPSFLELTDLITSEEFIHLHIATPGPLGIMAFIIGKLLGHIITFAYHTDLPNYAKIYTNDEEVENLFWKTLISLINNSDLCFVPSNYYKEILENKGVATHKLKVFKRGVNIGLFSPHKREKYYWNKELGLPEEAKIILQKLIPMP
ncbi:MAG: glycosyltransferase [Caldimicrobium sp.]